jgi:hypothetical protein
VVFRWAALILDAWLALARGLKSPFGGHRPIRDAWRALPGDLLGLAVMRGCSIDAPTRQVEAGDVTAVLVEDPRIERWFRAHLIPVQAQTLGHFVFARGPVPAEILAHECEHIRQWSRLGPFYLPLYFVSSAVAFLGGRRPYWDNFFESSARKRAGLETAAARDRENPDQR